MLARVDGIRAFRIAFDIHHVGLFEPVAVTPDAAIVMAVGRGMILVEFIVRRGSVVEAAGCMLMMVVLLARVMLDAGGFEVMRVSVDRPGRDARRVRSDVDKRRLLSGDVVVRG